MRDIGRTASALACACVAGCVSLPAGGVFTSTAAQSPAPQAQLPPARTAELQMALAEEMIKKGDRAGAVAQLEKARANAPSLDAKASHRLGVLYDELDERARALVEFERALKGDPHDAALLNDLGYCHYARGEWEQAEKYLRQAVQADGRNRRARMNLGMALAQQGKNDDALKAFGEVVSPAEAQANLGFILLSRGKRDEARAAYQHALELEPNLRIARTALDKLDAPADTAKGGG